MSFCKLISIQTFLILSIITVLALPKYTPTLFVKEILKYQDDKTMIFFLISFFPVINSFLYLFFYEVQNKKSKKAFKNSYYECVSLYFITFINILGAYIYKVEFSTFLRLVVFIIFNNQLVFVCNLLQFDTLKYYFTYNVLISNIFLIGLSYVKNFDLFCNEKILQIMKYKETLMKYFKSN